MGLCADTNSSDVSTAVKVGWQLIQLWSAAAVIRNEHRFTWNCRENDVSFLLKHISPSPLSSCCFLVPLHESSVGGTETQGEVQVREMWMQFRFNWMRPLRWQLYDSSSEHTGASYSTTANEWSCRQMIFLLSPEPPYFASLQMIDTFCSQWHFQSRKIKPF